MIEPQEGMKVSNVVDWARYAEEKGYGYFFRSDHLLPLSAESEQERAKDSPECWVTLGVVAALTKNLRFGPLVSPVGFRNPALLAKMACTLDSYSNGRMCLGLGAGWNEFEYRAHGYEFPPFKVRRKQVEEGYRIVRGMTEGRRMDFDGEYYSAHIYCYPRPAGKKVHLIGGGRNPRIVQTLGKYVDEWNVFTCPLDDFHKLKDILVKSRSTSATSNEEKAEISYMSSFLIAESRSELDAKLSKLRNIRGGNFGSDPGEILKRIRDGGRFAGLRDEFLAQLNDRVEAGVKKFYFQILDPGDKDMVDLLTETLKGM